MVHQINNMELLDISKVKFDTNNKLIKVDNKWNSKWKKEYKKTGGFYIKNKLTKKEKRNEKIDKKTREYKNRIPKQYKVYIKSKWWEDRKNKYYKDFGRRCFICKSVKYIVLHHLEYNNQEFGYEKDESLVALCTGCHEEFHSIYGTKKKMYKEFYDFINMKVDELLIQGI